MKLNKLLLLAAAGVVVYKVLGRVKIVKVDFPEDIFLGNITDALYNYTDDIKDGEDKEKVIEKLKETLGLTKIEIDGEKIAKGFEKIMQDNGNKTNITLNEKIVELASERPIDIQAASNEARKLIREYKEVSE
ncbi:MAG: hypothetical protein E6446_00185 [Gemella haemolysans]|nr:hypothetical protein [Gemella haemolysans]